MTIGCSIEKSSLIGTNITQVILKSIATPIRDPNFKFSRNILIEKAVFQRIRVFRDFLDKNDSFYQNFEQ